jgi:tetratricopeptide (TPR) repeat protein
MHRSLSSVSCGLPRGRARFSARHALAVLLLAGWGGGCVPAYEAKLESARARGDLDAAAELLAKASERAPDDPALVRERGILAGERGESAAASELLTRALVEMPNDPRTILHAAAASERAGLWDEATARYRDAGDLYWDADVAAKIDCQWAAVDEKRLSTLVEARLAAEDAGTLPAPTRILMLPFAAPQQSVALNLRTGLAALLADDWQAAEPAVVPYTELSALLSALSVAVDEPITSELRERLARLTGARYVLTGQLSEMNDLVSVAPVLIDRGADGARPQEWRLEYRQSRVATLVDLERTLVHHVATTLDIQLPVSAQQGTRVFAAESGLAVAMFGEAERLRRSGDRAQAVERLDASLGLDAEFRPAAEARVKLGDCAAVAGDPTTLLQSYEAGVRRERDRVAARELLAATTAANDRVGGAEGEGKDLSLNRPAASGSTSFTVRVPR